MCRNTCPGGWTPSRIYEMWGWDPDFTYRAPGRLVTVDSKVMLLYDFSSPEQWESKGKTR